MNTKTKVLIKHSKTLIDAEGDNSALRMMIFEAKCSTKKFLKASLDC